MIISIYKFPEYYEVYKIYWPTLYRYIQQVDPPQEWQTPVLA
jgi:hypothetical protein